MIGALGGVTLVAMLLTYRVDPRLVPVMWTVTVGAMLAVVGGWI